jgi:diguanylate cyclase (GGDEF)-like protein/PAS domain S-box-containing protein
MPFETDQKSGLSTGIFTRTREKLAEFARPVAVRHAALSVCFFALYLLLNRSDILMESQLGVTLWYPATGLALALLLGVNPWYTLLVCLAGVASDALIYHQPLASWSESLGSVAAAVIYAGAAVALRGSLRIDTGLNHRRDVVRYVFVTLTGAVLATLVGVRCLVADHTIAWNQFWTAAFSWFCGDSIALVVVAPFLLIHVLPWVRRELSAVPAKSVTRAVSSEKKMPRRILGTIAEAVGQGTSILVLLWVMFGHPLGRLQLFYLSFIPVIWIAMRHGIKRVVTGLLALNFGIVIALRIFPQEPAVLPKIGMLMLVVSFTGLLVGSAVSERHRLGKELRGQTDYLNSLIENTPLGIIVLDEDGRVERCNDAFERLFQFDRKQLIGNDLDSLISPIEASLRGGQFRAQLASGRPVHASSRCLRKDGTRIDVELSAVSLVQEGVVRGAYTIYKDISDQVRAAEQAKEHAASLHRLVEELQMQTNQMTLLSEMGDLLQCCATTEEAYSVISQSVKKLFPAPTCGMLYAFKSSRNALESVAIWGESRSSELVFVPDKCWALRRGRPHWSDPVAQGIPCAHLTNPAEATYLCVPMVGQGDTVGILFLEFPTGQQARTEPAADASRESRQRLATTVAGQLALSLANLRLRETLRDQSIRDPLTGLFNRRFMKEALDRELQRARRKKRPLTVVFIDLDHFKRFNDAFGHDAGDLVLRTMGELFLRHFRGDDVICRYGGEEFAIILPESTAKDAAKRANMLRIEASAISMRHLGQVLDSVTLSIGIAAFPEDGSTAEEILRAADQCLYQSKTDGRDRLTVATRQKTGPVKLGSTRN